MPNLFEHFFDERSGRPITEREYLKPQVKDSANRAKYKMIHHFYFRNAAYLTPKPTGTTDRRQGEFPACGLASPVGLFNPM